MHRAYPPSKGPSPHRRAVSEPINDYYRHKHLPRLPHEIDTYRTRSLPDLPPGNSKANNDDADEPPSNPAFESPLSKKNKPLPMAPLQTGQEVKKRTGSTVEEVDDTESFFPYWSKILLLRRESVGCWEEKLVFAREMQGCWTERRVFAHEVRKCALNCACGMV